MAGAKTDTISEWPVRNCEWPGDAPPRPRMLPSKSERLVRFRTINVNGRLEIVSGRNFYAVFPVLFLFPSHSHHAINFL